MSLFDPEDAEKALRDAGHGAAEQVRFYLRMMEDAEEDKDKIKAAAQLEAYLEKMVGKRVLSASQTIEDGSSGGSRRVMTLTESLERVNYGSKRLDAHVIGARNQKDTHQLASSLEHDHQAGIRELGDEVRASVGQDD